MLPDNMLPGVNAALAVVLFNAKLMLHRLIMVDNRIPVPATYIGTIAQYTITGCTKFTLGCVKWF